MLTRMAAMEFYFKEPFEAKEEYPILKSILFLALVPIELIFIFWYARIYGSLSRYSLQILFIMVTINLLIANLLINSIKNDSEIDEMIDYYDQLDYDSRKKIYSAKNITCLILLTGLLPWIVSGIAIAIICVVIPH